MPSVFQMFVTTVTSFAALSLLLVYKFQLKLIYPSSMNNGRKLTDKPSDYDLPYQEIFLETKDGIKLHTFLLLRPTPAKKTILILCPNAGNIGHALPIVEIFYKQFGYNVLIYSYRGYGESTGEATEVGLKIDADTALNFISTHEVLQHTSVILYGRSLGGAVAVYIAAKNLIYVKGVILENTFLSIRSCIPHIFPVLKNFTRLCHQIWNSEYEITKVDRNLKFLFLSADEDEIVPPEDMKKLFETCPSDHKRRIVFQGSHHNDTVIAEGYWDTVHDFIRQVEPIEKL